MQLLRASIGALLLAAFVSTPSISTAQVGAALPCPGAHFATQMEADAASPKGSIIAGVTYVCPTDAPLGINNDAGAAKDYLKTILCPPDGDNYGGYGPDETIRRLDPKFAQCAATFLKSLNTSGSPYCVREGARTVEKQNAYVARGVIACKKGAQCEHPRGIAIDINIVAGAKNDCTQYTRAHQTAPQFGLTFYMGCKDAYHFVPQKGGCTDANFVAPTGGAGSFPTGGTNANGILPSSFYDYPQYAPSSASPYSTALNALTPLLSNSLLGSNTQQPTVTTPTYTNPAPYEPVTLPTATSSIFTIPPPYTYQNLSTTTRPTTSGPSAYEQLEILSGSQTTGTSLGSGTGTSAPTQLNPDLTDIVKGNGTGGSNIVMDEGVMDTLAENSVKVNPIHVTETFSRDEPTLVAPATSSGLNTGANTSLVVALLTTLRNLLVTFVNILKSHSTDGFKGSWQAPATTPVYH